MKADGPSGSFRLFVFLSLSAFIALPLLSLGFGITWDEWMDANNGLLTLKHVLKAGRDAEFLTFWHGYLYSNLFYSFAGAVYGLLFDRLPQFTEAGLHRDVHMIPFFRTAHWLNALFGWAALVFTGLAARSAARKTSWSPACWAFGLLFLSPVFMGHAMNNPKDIPFAAAYTAGLWALMRFGKNGLKPSAENAAILALTLAVAIGTRVGGAILLIGYFALYSGWILIVEARRHSARTALSWASLCAGLALVAFWAGMLFWPYGHERPFAHLLQSVGEISNFQFGLGLTNFEGRRIPTEALPWWYLPKWIAISNPPLVVVSFVLFMVFAATRPRSVLHRDTALLALAVFFPLIYAVAKRSVLYDAWRHFLFVYPPLVALGAVALDRVADEWLRTPKARVAAGVVGFLLIADAAGWMLFQYPHYTVYFNPAAGGLRAAFGRYETDYWGNSLRLSAEWLADHHLKHHPNRSVTVLSEGHIMSSYPFLRQRLGSRYFAFGYEEDFLRERPYYTPPYRTDLDFNKPWDYALVLARSRTPEDLIHSWPPPGTIHEVKAVGRTLSAVVKNPRSKL